MSKAAMTMAMVTALAMGQSGIPYTGDITPMRRLDPNHRASKRRKDKRKAQKDARRRNRK